MLDLDSAQTFAANGDASFFSTLPQRPGVLLIEMADANAQPYLARTADIRRAAERLLNTPDTLSKKLNLRSVAARVRYRVTGSKFEQIVAHYQQARKYFPQRYKKLARIRPPAVLKVNLRNDYPRCYVTRGIRPDGGFYFGPFVSRRAANEFGERFSDLFQLRRCQIKIRRDPAFPGCIYSEMKMCLAPCFAGCSKEEYYSEVARAVGSLHTRGAQLVHETERERESASETLDFERAAALHKRLEKVSGAFRGLPEIAGNVAELNAVILQPAAEDKTIVAFPIRGGLLADPLFIRFGELSSEPRSVEAILRAGLEAPLETKGDQNAANDLGEGGPTSPEEVTASRPEEQLRNFGLRAMASELPEHLSFVTRWFYSNPRSGEIFFREADWPYRRILRACSRLLAPPADAPHAKNSPSGPSREQIRKLKAFSRSKRPTRK